ncbi:hypothetical protein CABS03_14551 [Colletotrichum abscissum]
MALRFLSRRPVSRAFRLLSDGKYSAVLRITRTTPLDEQGGRRQTQDPIIAHTRVHVPVRDRSGGTVCGPCRWSLQGPRHCFALAAAKLETEIRANATEYLAADICQYSGDQWKAVGN